MTDNNNFGADILDVSLGDEENRKLTIKSQAPK